MRNILYSFFDDPRISGVSKEFVKTLLRLGEGFMAGFWQAQLRRMARLNDRPFEEKKNGLVMMSVFVSFAQIFLRLFVKRLLAAKRTEVIGLSIVFRRTSCGRGVYVHVADGIVYSSCHRLSPFVRYDYHIYRSHYGELYYLLSYRHYCLWE